MSPDFPTMFTDVVGQSLGQPRRTAQAHLRHVLARQKRRNAVPKSLEPHVNFAQAVEKQQTGANHIVIELPFHKLQWRTRRYAEKFSAKGASTEEFIATLRT